MLTHQMAAINIVCQLAMRARSLEEKVKAAVEELPSGGGAAAIAAMGSTHTVRDTPSQAGLLLLSSQPEKLPCNTHPSSGCEKPPGLISLFAECTEMHNTVGQSSCCAVQPACETATVRARLWKQSPHETQYAQCLQAHEVC